MDKNTIVLAQLETEGCSAELYLNGVPVKRIAPPHVSIANVAVEHLLIAGDNKLELLVEPGATPSKARFGQHEVDYRPMRASGRLIRFRDGALGLVEHGDMLAEVNFIWTVPQPERRTFPLSLTTTTDPRRLHPRWGWQDAPPLNLDEALVEEACTVLDQVEQAFRSADADSFWRMTAKQLAEMRLAYPAVTEAAMRADLTKRMAHYQTISDPVMARVRSQHDFRLVAAGRMVELLDKDYTTSFKLRDPNTGAAVPYRMMLARIDGALTITR